MPGGNNSSTSAFSNQDVTNRYGLWISLLCMDVKFEPSNCADETPFPNAPIYIVFANGSATTPMIGPDSSHSAMFIANPVLLLTNDSVPSSGSIKK